MESVSAKEPHSALAQSFGAFASPSPRNRRQMLASNGRLSGMIIAVTGIDARQRVGSCVHTFSLTSKSRSNSSVDPTVAI